MRILVALFLFPLTSPAAWANPPGPHPRLADRRGPPPPVAPSREEERKFLPEVTAVQKWKEIDIISERQNFAPSIIQLSKGGYRIYWNDAKAGGLTSKYSSDLRVFVKEGGVRLADGKKGSLDCVASHPWVVDAPGGYRMYYQGNATCNRGPGQAPVYRIFSAFSEDGLNFKREGIRVDIGRSTGLSQAAHGRILRMDDGRLRLFFSASFTGKKGPADILGASSTDGLSWALDDKAILERGHDPAVIRVGRTIYLYCTFLRDNLLVLDSSDGFHFTAKSWLEFYNGAGERIEEFGDIDIIQGEDGKLRIFGSGKGSPGLGIYVPQE